MKSDGGSVCLREQKETARSKVPHHPLTGVEQPRYEALDLSGCEGCRRGIDIDASSEARDRLEHSARVTSYDAYDDDSPECHRD
jgi:hypothetical protein